MESTVSFLSTVSPCQYLPDRIWQLRYELVPHLRPADYMHRLQQGWRRSSYAVYRPDCTSCRMCQSLRVPVTTFRPSPSQRRTWKRNQGEVTVRVGAPSLSPDRLDLWTRFHIHGHEKKGWPAEAGADPGMLLENPFRTEEWTYRWEPVDRRCYVTPCLGPLAIYCYYDPAERDRSPGTFNILSLLACSRAGTSARLPRLLHRGMSVDGIQA